MRASWFGAVLALGLSGCNFVVDGVEPGASTDPGDLAMADDLGDGADLGAAGDLAPPTDLTPASGLLSGAIAPASGTIDLTVEGTRDWAHWGTTTNTSFDHKSPGAAGGISDFTTLGALVPSQLGTYAIGFTWSDGTPTTTAANSTTGVYTDGDGAGFRITAPADTTTRTLRLYAGGQTSTAVVTAHLSDGSAADYTATATLASGETTMYERVVTITYRALSAGQTVRVDWAEMGTGGYVHLHSASLQ